MVKRYYLFAGDNYYPLGGGSDFIKSYEQLEDAVAFGERIKEKGSMDWWHVFDSQTEEIVRREY